MSSESQLNSSEIISESWVALSPQLALVAGLSLVFSIGMGILAMVHVVGYLLMAPLTIGYLKCLVQIRNKQVFQFSDLFWCFHNMNRMIHSILLSLIVPLGYLGFILLIPGIWWVVASCFSNVLFLIGPEDSIGAIKKSMALVKGRWWNIANLLGLVFLINFAGALCFAVGLLVSLPVTTLALFIAAEKLLRIPALTPPQFVETKIPESPAVSVTSVNTMNTSETSADSPVVAP